VVSDSAAVDRMREQLANLGMSIGRGVADYVKRNGGRLYLWGEPSGAGFYELLAGTHPPAAREFVRSNTVREFELYLEAGLQLGQAVHLARRWFGFRDGVVAATPASMVTAG
jgi:hypothetical protein